MSKVSETKFTDIDFSPTSSSIGYLSRILEKIVWIRAPDINQTISMFPTDRDPLPTDPVYIETSESLSHVVAVFSSICSRSDYLRSIFVTYNPNVGFAAINLWCNSRVELVIIDDFIPCFKESLQPVFGNSVDGFLWLPLLQKALAKTYGSYSSLSHLNPASIFRDITGEVVLDYRIQASVNDKNVLMSFVGRFESKMILGACARMKRLNSATKDDVHHPQIVCNKVYSILSLRSIKSDLQLLIRDCSSSCTVSKKSVDRCRKEEGSLEKFAYTGIDNSCFWIDMIAFTRTFNVVHLCPLTVASGIF